MMNSHVTYQRKSGRYERVIIVWWAFLGVILLATATLIDQPTLRIELHPIQTETLTPEQLLTAESHGTKVTIAGELRMPFCIQKNVPEASVPKYIRQAREQQALDYQRNSEYTVFIFHSNNNMALDAAKTISTKLLIRGFRSSSTETDFSELRNSHPPGTVYVKHSQRLKAVLPKITELIQYLGVNENLIVQQSTTNLSHSDVQILVF
jgi:hypothetical protein